MVLAAKDRMKVTGIDDDRAFGFFFAAPASHHLYYLLPYVRATKRRSIFVFDSNDDYNAALNQAFPDVNFIACSTEDSSEIAANLSRYSVLMFANGYRWFVNDVQPHLAAETLLVRVLHGSGNKFADDAGYYAANVYAWDAVVVFGRKDLDLFYAFHGLATEQRQYPEAVHIKRRERGDILLVQSGNLRARHFIESKPRAEHIRQAFPFMDPDKKTILLMSTHSSNPEQTVNSYSGLGFFLELLDAMDDPENYNFLINLHPNLVREAVLMKALQEACAEKGIPLNYDPFTSDFLPMMRLADVLICDRTSAVFEFLIFDKPIIFLDNTGECPVEIAWNDLQNPFWTYRNGSVISPSDRDDFEDVLELSLRHDAHKEVRRRCFEYAYSTSETTAETVMSALLSHPKLGDPSG